MNLTVKTKQETPLKSVTTTDVTVAKLEYNSKRLKENLKNLTVTLDMIILSVK